MAVAVKINGVLSHVLEPVSDIVKDEGAMSKFWTWLGDVSDKVISTEVEFILKPVFNFIGEGVMGIINLLNSFSVEIITLSIIACGVGIIIGPLFGSSPSKWVGRIMFFALTGAVWRMMLQ